MNIALVGLGNILLKDEGVGVHVINAVKKRYAFSPGVEIIDGGTMGLDLLPVFQMHERVLIVDAVDFGREPGHTRTVENDRIPSVLNPKLSAHHIGLSDILFTAKLTGDKPLSVCLIGIQPELIEPGLDMTDEINGKIDKLIDSVIEKLKEWNIECVSQSPQGLST